LDDAPIRIILLRDADKCAFNESLEEARCKLTIKELECEYENWFNLFGESIDSSKNELQNEFPRVRGGLAQCIGCQNGITAYVDGDRMWFVPITLI